LKPVKERVAELGQGPELPLWVYHQRVSGYNRLLFVVHDDYETVGGGFGTDADAGELGLQQVFNERCFARGILADQQYHRLGVKVGVVQLGRMEVVELIRQFQR